MVDSQEERNESEFGGTERFTVLRRLGRGGMGVVYLAHDRDRDAEVALKTLQQLEADRIVQLKHEFRSLADVTHPNLVALHELVATDREWFFTMELVSGLDFLSHVTHRDPRHGSAAATAGHIDSSEITLDGLAPGPALPVEPADGIERPTAVLPPTVVDLDRLVSSLGQLTDAVCAIHDAGKLHLDLKPTNVLVEDDGRVVVLDFGIVQDRSADEDRQRGETRRISGTPHYMAPEQAAGRPLSTAADWYSVGVMLFEALTGKVPFAGRPEDARVAKQTLDPVPPSSMVCGVPDELDRLCLMLLHRDPGTRAGRDEIRAVLGDRRALSAARRSDFASPLIGRGAELEILEAAWRSTRNGRPSAVLVSGLPGIGKTALVQRFLESARGHGALVLAGRCYERESLPYKAVDAVVDALTRHLQGLPRHQAAAILPRGSHALARLFPTMRQIAALEDVPRPRVDIPDERELRRIAFAGLKDLMRGLSDAADVVVFIDDVHWGDRDSAVLLTDVLGPPDPPPLLLITTYRPDEGATSEFLATAGAALRNQRLIDVREVSLDGLSADEARGLVTSVLGTDAEAVSLTAEGIASDTAGNPLFIIQLARHFKDVSPEERRLATGAFTDLSAIVRAQIGHLNDEERRLLEVVAVAGAPIEQGVACRAAHLSRDPLRSIGRLRGRDLVRTRGAGDRDLIEAFHDRIRETAVEGMSETRRLATHAMIADELERTGRADPEALALHLEHAGRRDHAAAYAVTAGEQAAEALAFDNAAALFARAIALREWPPERRREIEIHLGDALVNAGRGAEAADAFLRAATGAPDEQAFDLKRRAMEQLLITGHTDRGLEVMHEVLGAVGLRFSTSPSRALVSLLARQTWLRLRGLGFRRRAADEIPPERLRLLDVSYNVSLGLSMVDPLIGSSFQALHLLHALDAGEPNRVALGLAVETGHLATQGGAALQRAVTYISTASELAAESGDPRLVGMTTAISAVPSFGLGEWQECIERSERAETVLREQCTGVTWELDTAQIFATIAMAARGDLARLRTRLPEWTREADERGDLYASTSLRVFWRAATLLKLADDDPEGARLDLTEAMQRWSRLKFYVQDYYAMWGHVVIDLYTGDAEAAWNRAQQMRSQFRRSLLSLVQMFRMTTRMLHAQAALAVASRDAQRAGALTRIAARDARAIAREKVRYGMPEVASIRAAVASIRDRPDDTVTLLRTAVSGYDEADMLLHAAVARRKLARRIGGAEAEQLLAHSTHYMTDHEVRDPDRLASALAPGFE